MKADVAMVACVKQKADRPLAAKDLYTWPGSGWRGATSRHGPEEMVRALCTPWSGR
jgi:hypothetical protein